MSRLVPLAAAMILFACNPPPGGMDAGESDAGSCGADVTNDPLNCGACGSVCPVPLHAAAVCARGVCGRSACEPGFFDLDGAPGCESTCTGRTCIDGSGNTITLTAPPLAERGLTFAGASSGASWGSRVQTSSGFTHLGVMGEAFSPSADGPLSTSNTFQHAGGVSAVQQVFRP